MPTINLSSITERNQLEEIIKSDINDFCQKEYASEHRDHLGASVLGEPCSRKLWYSFRWAKLEDFSGRMLRLFQVGHDAEPRFIKYLRGIGFEVWERDPNTGKQYRFEGVNGHYGGSCDGVCKPPARYNLDSDIVLLDEFKTNGTGAGFSNVEVKGVLTEKPKHYAQMCQFGPNLNLKWGLYIIENKNDSDLTVKIVELDWNYAAQLETKAKDIIEAQEPPRKISLNSASFRCKFCSFIEVCHYNADVEKNCRSCKNAKPVENAEWYCGHWKAIIPKAEIKKGCQEHVSVNI